LHSEPSLLAVLRAKDNANARQGALKYPEIKDALSGLKCRCGTHICILKAVKRAAEMMG